MRKKKTNNEFIKELKLINPEIIVIGKYVGSLTKIKIQHTCGYKWEAIPNNLLKGSSCPKCSKIKTSKKRSKTTKQFIEELKIVNPEITVIDEYVNMRTKIEVKHNCGYQWKVTPNSLLQGNSCPNCAINAKKTTEQFSEELKIVNPEITLLGKYVGSLTKIEVKHNCGYQWKVTPNSLLQGNSCPKCSRVKANKKKTKTTKQFIEELKIVNPEITVIGKYIGALTKIEVQHTCGYKWKPAPSSLLQGNSCPKCSRVKANKKKNKTTKQFIEELKIVNPEIIVIGKYVGSLTKIKIQHTCGNKWEAIPNNLLKGSSCPKCSKIKTSKKRSKTTKQFIEELKIVNPEITVIDEYVNMRTKIEVKHNCGYQWKVTPNSLLQGNSCPNCAINAKKTTEQFSEELKIVNPEITLLCKYVGSLTKIKIQHTCGNKWEAIPKNLLKGSSCPRCNESKGEKFLSKVLKSNNIPFISQFNLVKNPKTNYWLKSDFAILNKENKPILILEYDGEQHFKPIEYFGGEEKLKATQYRDYLKDEYCKENNISFLRFNYKQSENDIEDLLLKQLKKMELI